MWLQPKPSFWRREQWTRWREGVGILEILTLPCHVWPPYQTTLRKNPNPSLRFHSMAGLYNAATVYHVPCRISHVITWRETELFPEQPRVCGRRRPRVRDRKLSSTMAKKLSIRFSMIWGLLYFQHPPAHRNLWDLKVGHVFTERKQVET